VECGHEHVEPGGFGGVELFAVSKGVPPVVRGFLDDVVRQGRADAPPRPVVDENPHQRAGTGASRLRAANSSTAFAP